jgi:hypothetical protein
MLNLPLQVANKAGCPSSLSCEGATVAEALAHATQIYPALANKIYATPGKLNRYARVFVDGKMCLGNIDDVAVGPAGEIKILIALAGG